jgi:YD repeat-containing protein
MNKVFTSLALIVLLISSLAHAEQRYFYDSLGRLAAEIDSVGNVAFYEYDAVGNLLAIRQGDPEQLSLVSFSPTKGPVGTTVTILGSGFSSTLSENQLFVNDTPATVLSAENASIVFTVPSGATTSLIKVTTPRGTVQSAQPFTVISGPAITSIDPNRVGQGSVVVATIYGQGLPSVGQVTFSDSRITATIMSGGDGTKLPIRLTVASNTPPGSYPFTITTNDNVIESGSVIVTVTAPVSSFSTAPPLSVFKPYSAGIAPSGPVITSAPHGISVYVPSPTEISPSGSSMVVAPPESVSMP